MRVSQSVNAASSATSWDDLGSVIDQTISMSLLERDAASRPKLTNASKSERVLSSIPSKLKNARKARSTMRVSQSVNAASSATSWDDLGSVIDQTISMSLLETK